MYGAEEAPERNGGATLVCGLIPPEFAVARALSAEQIQTMLANAPKMQHRCCSKLCLDKLERSDPGWIDRTREELKIIKRNARDGSSRRNAATSSPDDGISVGVVECRIQRITSKRARHYSSD